VAILAAPPQWAFVSTLTPPYTRIFGRHGRGAVIRKTVLTVSIIVVATGQTACSCNVTLAGDAHGDTAVELCPDVMEDLQHDLPGEIHGDMDEEWEPGGPYWTIHEIEAEVMQKLPGPPPHDQAPVRFLLEATLPDACWEGAPVLVLRDWSDPGILLLVMRAWHLEMSECAAVESTLSRTVTVTLSAGCWTVVEPLSGLGTNVSVQQYSGDAACAGYPDGAGVGVECERSCQCMHPLVCLSSEMERRACYEPCTIDADCMGHPCVPFATGGLCAEFVESDCLLDTDCPDGERCITSSDGSIRICTEYHELSEETRHACSSNEDCEAPGHECTLASWPFSASDTPTGAGVCNVRCPTAASEICACHSCMGGGFNPENVLSPVCDWVGE
jgi:hypothetical protein